MDNFKTYFENFYLNLIVLKFLQLYYNNLVITVRNQWLIVMGLLLIINILTDLFIIKAYITNLVSKENFIVINFKINFNNKFG